MNAERVHEARGDQKTEKRARQHHKRRREPGVRHGVDEHLHGDRRREEQKADPDAVDERETEKPALRAQDLHPISPDIAQRDVVVGFGGHYRSRTFRPL